MQPYTTRWGKLRQLQLPSSMVPNGVLNLKAADLKVLIALFHIHRVRFKFRKHDESAASVKVTQKTLMKRTGYTRAATISDAVRSLELAGFVTILWDRQGSTKRGAVSSEYFLTQPGIEGFIPLTLGNRNILGPLGIKYFTIPTCLLTSTARWSLANLARSEARLYVAMLWAANVERAHEFTRTNVQLYKLADLTPVTFGKALDKLQLHGLISVTESVGSKELTVQLCDPFTGEPMHLPDGDDESDPANYFTTNANGTSRRLSWNTGNVQELEQLIRDSVNEGDPVFPQSNGDLLVRCPFHNDTKPSCSVSPSKRCFNCFSCQEKGTLSKLITILTGGSKGSAIKRIASVSGQTAEFHQPDSKAIARYTYRDFMGNLAKLVLRFANDENGNKVFSQRRWTKDGWAPNVKGFGPMLYNADLLRYADTVAILEGEKDADSLTDLHLRGHGGMPVIGLTSGGSGTWHTKLGKLLRGKVVVVMPDNDGSGETYADAVTATLDAECIKYKKISFAGTGAKDVTEFLSNGHTAEDLVHLLGSEWVTMPEGPIPGATGEFSDEPVQI